MKAPANSAALKHKEAGADLARASQEDASPALEQAVDQVLKLLQSGGTIGEFLGHTRESMESLYSVGYSLYGQGKYQEAEKAFGALLICNHTDRRVYHAYAACLQMQGRYPEAIRHYALSALMDPTDPSPVFYCAECLIAMGKREEALDSLERVLDMPPRSPQDSALAARARGLLDLLKPPAGAVAVESPTEARK
jgi:type III secretion system low calcium response chaperone LcrH/SycD